MWETSGEEKFPKKITFYFKDFNVILTEYFLKLTNFIYSWNYIVLHANFTPLFELKIYHLRII